MDNEAGGCESGGSPRSVENLLTINEMTLTCPANGHLTVVTCHYESKGRTLIAAVIHVTNEYEMAFPTMTPFICLLFVLFETFVPSAVAAPSGTEFVFAPMPNHPNFIRHSTIGVILQATTDEPTTVRIEIPERSIARQIPLSPGSGPFLYSLARTLIHQTTSGPIDSTICVSSDKAISALHYNLDPSNSDMFTLMPLHTLGKEYFVATITWGSNPAEGSGVISISSLRESVSLEVHVTSTVRFVDETFNSGDVFRYTLRPFKSIQLLPQYTGITGTRILANTTISVSAGAKCANVPEGVEYCDHIAEQLAPFTAWGKMFLLSPFVRRASGYVFQVVAGRDQTTVLYNDVIERLNMGQFVTVNILSQTMTFVSSDKPISVMQYSKGRTSDRVTESDPSMIRVPPIEQFVSETIFPVYDFSTESTHINTVHLELTAECRYFDNIFVFKDNQPFSVTWIKNYSMEILDGTRVCSQWSMITGGTYTVRSQRINTTEGHTFYPRFCAVVYGTGSGESYLYRAGASDRPLTCSNSSLGAPAEEHDCPILINPEIVSLMATNLSITWNMIPSATGLFDTCTVYITSEEGIARPVAIATPPYAATLSGLQPYTEYSFYMNCSNSLGIRSILDFPSQTTLKAEPHPPTNVTVTEVTQTSAVVSWEPPRVSNGDGAVDGYVVFAELRNCLSTSCSTFLKEYKTEVTSQSVQLDPFATYSVVVIAYNIESRIPSPGDMLNSSRAISDEFTTLKAEPGPPNDVVVNEVTESSALVSWTQPSVTHGPIDGYTVYAIPVSCSSVSCTSAKTDVSSSIMEHTLTLRSYISYRAVVVAFTLEPRMPDHAKQNSTLAYSNTFTTLQTVPVKPAPSSTLSGGLTHYSFDINIPAYQNPNGPVSCFEVIVVQLYDAATSIDSDDNAYSINNTRDFSLAKTRIGTPFRALAFSIIPDGNVITVGFKAEVHSECNTGIETNEDDRRRRKRRTTTVRATTLHAINGPLNPDSYYSCFIRVYSPSHREGEVYFANGPFIQPIRLKVPGIGISFTTGIVSGVILVFIVVVILLVCICKRKRSRQEASRNSPFSAGVFYRHCTDALPQNPPSSPGTQQQSHEYDSFDKKSSPVYENVEKELVEGEYEFMIYRSEGKGFSNN